MIPDDRAACDGEWELFDRTDPVGIAEQINMCHTCPVINACLKLALDTPGRSGTWAGRYFGGLQWSERAVFDATNEATCGNKRGTNAGARRHNRNGERACDPCRIAANAYSTDRNKKRPKTKFCVDCGKGIGVDATRCQACGCGSKRAYQRESRVA